VHHQHVSHLFGLFPGHTISVEKTPDLCKAADYTLYKRGSHAITDYLDSKVFFFFFFFMFYFAFGLYLIICYYTRKRKYFDTCDTFTHAKYYYVGLWQ